MIWYNVNISLMLSSQDKILLSGVQILILIQVICKTIVAKFVFCFTFVVVFVRILLYTEAI